jgi:hypothetical protein
LCCITGIPTAIEVYLACEAIIKFFEVSEARVGKLPIQLFKICAVISAKKNESEVQVRSRMSILTNINNISFWLR